MKKIIFLAAVALVGFTATAQNAKYVSAMEKNIAILDTTRAAEPLQNLANNFERIAGAEKTEWLPDYYAAYCYVNITYSTKGNTTDTYCDKAEALIKAADALSPNNSEIYALRSQITTARISVSPMTRGQKYGAEAAELRDKAKELDPTNPRPYYMEGTSLFYTPSMFGGGKDKAKPVFEKAAKMFETFKPASSIAPHWGLSATNYFLKKCEEK